MDMIFLRHQAPRFSPQAESHVSVLALGNTLPARPRCRGPVLVSCFIGRFAPRRLSLPSTPDGSPSLCSRASLGCRRAA